jgi:exonuclease III
VLVLRLISWNVAGRVARQPEQLEALLARRWDVVCLQEITPTTLKAWRSGLQEGGLTQVRTSIDEWIPGEQPPDDRRLGVLTASRAPFEVFGSAHPPWPERFLSARLGSADALELHNLHSPISQKPGRVKLRTHRAIAGYLAHSCGRPQLLVGDLNTPRRELADGSTWSFARTARGAFRIDRGEEWERAELAVLRGLEDRGVRDLFRDLHGYERAEISFAAGRGGWRLDHMVGSRHLSAAACEYDHAVREAGLSDHSAMWAEVELR